MKEIYKDLNDEELIARYMDGDKAVVDFLMDKYKYLVRGQAGNMYLLGADHEDLLQEGMIGLFKAIRDYDPGRDASFQTFAKLCISRQIFTAVEAANRHKHAPLNSYIKYCPSSEKRVLSMNTHTYFLSGSNVIFSFTHLPKSSL